MIVVDASVIIEILLQSPAAAAIEDRLFTAGESLHAPHLLDIEVTQVLRRYARLGELAQGERSRAALAILTDISIQRYPHAHLLPRIWELRHNLSAYDAAYVALAEALGAVLLTRDRRLAAVKGLQAKIELV